MKYSQRDLRAIDVFALILIGVGILFFAIGALRYIGSPKINGAISYKDKAAKIENSQKAEEGSAVVEIVNWPAIRTGLFGTVFILLGTTMNIGLRRVMRHGGTDVDQDAARPAS